MAKCPKTKKINKMMIHSMATLSNTKMMKTKIKNDFVYLWIQIIIFRLFNMKFMKFKKLKISCQI